MEQTKVPDNLNEPSIVTNINLQLQNSENIKNPPNSKLKIILIALAVFAVLLAFILILLFVIIKVHKNDLKAKIRRSNNRKPIIIDVDEGGDDMIAYIVANNSKKYDILGITTVSSYYYVEDVGKIWLRFLEYMNFDNKVYLGENHPLVRQTEKINFSHNYGFELPNTTKTYETKGAVDLCIKLLKIIKRKLQYLL